MKFYGLDFGDRTDGILELPPKYKTTAYTHLDIETYLMQFHPYGGWSSLPVHTLFLQPFKILRKAKSGIIVCQDRMDLKNKLICSSTRMAYLNVGDTYLFECYWSDTFEISIKDDIYNISTKELLVPSDWRGQ